MFIYLITSPTGHQYVGKTVANVRRRWLEHKSDALKRRVRSRLHNAIRKHGPEVFKVQPIAQFTNHEQLVRAEQLFIAELGTRSPQGYNLTDGGDGSIGYRHTEDSLRKMRGRRSPLTPEHRRRISVSGKGIRKPGRINAPWTLERRAKVKATWENKRWSTQQS